MTLTAKEQDDVAKLALRLSEAGPLTQNELVTWWTGELKREPSQLRVASKYMLENGLAEARTAGKVRLLALAAPKPDKVQTAIDLASKMLGPLSSSMTPEERTAALQAANGRHPGDCTCGACILTRKPSATPPPPPDPPAEPRAAPRPLAVPPPDADGTVWVSAGEAERLAGRTGEMLRKSGKVRHRLMDKDGPSGKGRPWFYAKADCEAYRANRGAPTHGGLQDTHDDGDSRIPYRPIAAGPSTVPTIEAIAAAKGIPVTYLMGDPGPAPVVHESMADLSQWKAAVADKQKAAGERLAERVSELGAELAERVGGGGTLPVQLSAVAMTVLEEMRATGLYGATLEQVARAMVLRGCRVYRRRPLPKKP